MKNNDLFIAIVALLMAVASLAISVIASRESYPEVLIAFRLCAIGTKTQGES